MKIRSLLGVAAALCTSAGLAQAQAPSNDLCANAIPVAIPSVTTGTTIGATVEAGPPPTCVTTYSAPGVWYTLVGNGNTLTVDTCTGGSYDSKLHVYCTTNANPCASPTTFSCVTGNDDTSGCGTGASSRVTFCSALNQTYYILVSGFSSATGNFTLTVADGAACSTAVSCAPPGTCCSSSGTCSLVAPTSCTGTSTFLGGTSCSPNPCTALLGACCNNTTGVCSSTTTNGCTTGSSFQGAGSACTPQPGPCPGAGACCSSTGTCSITSAGGCTAATSFFVGAGSVCSPTNACTPRLGACCNTTTGACSSTIQQGCTSPSTFQGAGSTCSPTNPCGGACCNGTTCTVTLNAAGCTTGVFTAGNLCSPNSCSGACCTTAGVCSVTGPAACTSPSVFSSGATCTPTPGPCAQPNGPSNDFCANAIAISSASLPAVVNGDNTLASTDPMPAVCASSQKDVWYTFTPTITQNYSVRTCGGLTGTLDTVVSIHSACPTALVNNQLTGGCNDDGCQGVGASQISSISLTAGTTYWIRVARFGTTSGNAGGPFTLTIDQITGACCSNSSGTCSITTAANCPSPNQWTNGGVCGTVVCTGACCAGDGSCSTNSTGCAAGANFQGLGTTCTPNTCPIPTGACCATDGTCSVTTAANCASPSLWAGGSTVCNASVCVRGSCLVTGTPCNTCTQTISSLCTGGGTFTAGGACPSGPANDLCSNAIVILANSLPVTVTGTSCGADTAADGPAGSCTTGNTRAIWWSFTPAATASYKINTCGSDYDTVLTVFSGGCASPVEVGCDDDEPTCANTLNSQISAVTLTAGTTYLIRVGSFGTATGGVSVTISANSALGSCCAADGTCTQSDAANCAAGNTFNAGGSCSPNICPQPNGACCNGASCTITAPGGCTGANHAFAGSGSSCTPYSFTTPCCRGDFNKTGAPPSVQDIFDFLAAYFSGC